MIDPMTEHLVTFAEVAASLPPSRKGRPVHVTSLYRWQSPGLHGITLETIVAGGRTLTSKEAVARFFAALTEARRGGAVAPAEPPARRSPGRRKREADAAAAELARRGA